MDPRTKFQLAINEFEQRQRAGRLLIAEGARELELAERKRAEGHGHRFSVARALRKMTATGGGGLNENDGIEGEVCAEAARQSGGSHDRNRIVIPLHLLATRALTVAQGTDGGYLAAQSDRPFVVDLLRPYSVTARLGVRVVPSLKSSFSIPRTSAAATAGWPANETTQAGDSSPTLGTVAMAPKAVGAHITISGQLLLQSPQLVDELVTTNLLLGVGGVLDKAVLAGTGAPGPTGVLNTTGVGTNSGSTLAWAGLGTMLESAGTANVNDDNITVLTTPTVRKLLQGRETAAGAGPVWVNNTVAGKRAVVSSDVPSGVMFMGDFGQVLVGIWGAGLVVEHDPYTGFRSGQHGYRCILHADVGVLNPAAFQVCTSIT